MANPHQPDMGARVLAPQVIRGGNGILAESIVPAVDIYSHNLSLVVRLDKMADVPLVNLFTEAGLLLARSSGGSHGFTNSGG